MMWRLRNYLFGTHFVAMEFGSNEYVRPVRFALDGSPYVKICGTFCWLVGDRRERWVALTFNKQSWLAQYVEERPRPKLRSVP